MTRLPWGELRYETPLADKVTARKMPNPGRETGERFGRPYASIAHISLSNSWGKDRIWWVGRRVSREFSGNPETCRPVACCIK